MSSNETSAAPTAPPPGFDATQILGPLQYGLLFSWLLLGLLFHQVYTYNTKFAKNDSLLFKVVVHLVLALELMFTGFMTHLVHVLALDGWGNMAVLGSLPFSAVMVAPSTGCVAVVVQLFFLWRLWKINQGSLIMSILVGFVGLIAFTHFACSIALAYTWGSDSRGIAVSKTDPKLIGLILTYLVGVFVVDIFITVLMVASLVAIRRRSRAVKSTSEKINSLIIRAIETGVVTTAFAMIELILYLDPKQKGNIYWVTCALCLGKLYSTMLMANMNGRGQFSGAQTVQVSESMLSGRHDVELSTTSINPAHRSGANIMITTQVETDDDAFDNVKGGGQAYAMSPQEKRF